MILKSLGSLAILAGLATAATTLSYYFGHAPVADQHGVIAPWYKGQNGQFDFRVRMAAETLKRYPWASGGQAVAPAPEYVYNGTWNIDHEGTITAVPEKDWANGDLGQRASYVLGSLIDYYAYSGDPAVFTPITAMADYLIEHCQTDSGHGWPNMLISVPTMGKRYGQCVLGSSDELTKGEGKIQLDNVAQVGFELVRAYEMTGNARWLNAARHWADLLARNRSRVPGEAPWGRYANNAGGAGMNGVQTGGVGILLLFFDELIRTGYTGPDSAIVQARDAGRQYLRDVLLPAWTTRDSWGRNFWDWEAPVQDLFGTEYPLIQLLNHKDYFANWTNDVRNILGLFINHAGVGLDSGGEVFHGAWAYPESSDCCGRSLWYSPMELAALFARYGVEADSEWAREIARRSQLLATYDPLPDGQSMDLIDGGAMVNLRWFKIAHPMALKYVLRTMGWLPEVMGANRENHIMRPSSVVKRVVYGKDGIVYSVFDAPANAVDVLRLSYAPASVTADGKPLSARSDLAANGYTVKNLPGGDAIVSIRHDGATEIAVRGPDPQKVVEGKDLGLDRSWRLSSGAYMASQAEATMTVRFAGNQARLVGRVGPNGGLADVYVDDFKQLAPVDFHSPVRLERQILYYRSGLANGSHTLKIVARGSRNALSQGNEVAVQEVQYSDATGDSGFGEGGGPTDTQRMIFGYTGRTDYRDTQGNLWRPASEFVVRTGHLTDSVAKAWWTMQQAVFIQGTADQDLYRYGAHWKEFITNVTVGPGTYHVRMKFAETQHEGPNQRGITIYVNDQKMVEGFDVFATAGGANKAVDLVYNNIQPKEGVIEIRLEGSMIGGVPKEAMLQALEVGPGDGGSGAIPKTIAGL
jgi:hypothetical protein